MTGYFYQVYLHGEELTFVVIDRVGNRSDEMKLNALMDTIAPKPIENIIFNENGQNFTAQAEANSFISVKMLRVSLLAMVMSIVLVMCPVTSIRFT